MSFTIDLNKVTNKYENRLDLIIRRIAFDLFSRVIMRSPVDKGRFRANWQLGIGIKPNGVIDEIDKGPVTQTGEGKSKTKDAVEGGLSKVKAGDVLHLANNLPYSKRLEEGWSPQAQDGVLGVTVSEFENIVKKVGGEVRET